MAVTKQTYTAAATWTAAQLADIFRSAFIDAGLMTDWFDSFASGGIENRVLRVINNPAKTYGTVYYWFMFTTGGAYISTALQWSAAGDVPTGTQYLDFYSNVNNVTTNHRLFFSAANTTTVEITRYTSSITPSCTWFVPRNSGSIMTFLIPWGAYNATNLVDQDKMAFNGAVYVTAATEATNNSYIGFNNFAGNLRRTFLGAASLRGTTTLSNYMGANALHGLNVYRSFGNANNGSTGNFGLGYGTNLLTAFANTNTGITDHSPVFTSISPSPYLPALPSDFGLAVYYTSSSIALQDTMVVAAGTEEYELIGLANNASVDSGRVLFLARTVG